MLMYELVQSGAPEEVDEKHMSGASIADAVEVAIKDSDSQAETISETTGDSTGPAEGISALIKHGVPTPPDSEADFELVNSKLEKIKVSPPSSVGSHSTYDSDQLEQRQTTRSTSFSSIHSRPRTPIFEEKDPLTSPPPPKKLRVEIVDLGRVEHFSP